MSKILNLRKHIYLKRVGILFIAIALIAGVVGCEGEGEAEYDLAMAVNPAAGGTATDETGTSPYAEGTDVDIKAVPAAGYEFVSWTASAGTFANANRAETTFTMPDEDATVTANFVGTLDHATGYMVDLETVPHIGEEVYLEDQFGAFHAVVEDAIAFATPAEKLYDNETTPILNPDDCLTLYWISCEEDAQEWQVTVSNQFGTQDLTVAGPFGLAVPTQNEGHGVPMALDHYLLYEVTDYTYLDEITVELYDEFLDEPLVTAIYAPYVFASPVKKTHGTEITEILNPDVHSVGYMTAGLGDVLETVDIVNQFGEQTLDVEGPYGVIVPSEKLDWAPVVPLDHFKGYLTADVEELPIGADVYLEDQFGALNATVGAVAGFCNPAEKVHDGLTTPISSPDHHFTAYNISYEGGPHEWVVEVYNQFGYQELTVSGPFALGVPTQKEGHEAPVGLDHYLIYEVIDGPYIEEVVGLNDQFCEQPEFSVILPVAFANPVRKTYGSEVTEILHPNDHLVIYGGAASGQYFETTVQVTNQFGEQTLHVIQEETAALAVPSEKIDYWEMEPQPDDPLAFVAVMGDYSHQLTNLLRANGFWTDQRDWDVTSDIGDYDVVVVNMPDDPGEATFQVFLDAADTNVVGVVFTSSWGVYPYGISLLHWYLGDPAGQGYNYGDGDVYYKVTQDHAIFDGWTVDDEIIIITGGDCDHAWFSGYSGTTIADVGNADYGIQGDAVAVSTYGASTHVLLASLGPQWWTGVTAWTDDGVTIFVNAVSFAAGI